MTTTLRAESISDSDAALWELVCQGNAEAFEIVVRRHQSLICSVAYSTCGDLAQSEDLAQETFWTAWRQRSTLEQPDRLKAWLSGIARNLAKNARRKASRPGESPGKLDPHYDFAAEIPDPGEEAVSREEELILWRTIERIPEAYREPLILFYREGQSVAAVAEALMLSEDAVKQRLSRGRQMLRDQVADLVEGGLRRSRPGRRFTLSVIAGLAVKAVGAKPALAGASLGTGAWKAAAGAAGAGGVLGGFLGTLIGLLGAWVGTWVPAQAARTQRERSAFTRGGRRMMLVSIAFILTLFGLIYGFAGSLSYVFAWAGWMVGFSIYIAIESFFLSRQIQRIRSENDPADLPNETALRLGLASVAARIGERVYRSQACLLGLPLIDINLSAPGPRGVENRGSSAGAPGGRRIARGWVAIGDDARGILLAVGSTARGILAIGGRAFGVVCVGGVALGLVAFGGLSLGVVGIGGLGAGVYAIGGGAIGWRAAGGLAIGWDMACGGGAFAGHGAVGGAAIARDYAVGGEARARHANDLAAREVLLRHPFTRFAFTVMGQRQVLRELTAVGAALPAAADVEQFALGNGLKVRFRPIQGASNVALLVLFNVGGDHDPEGRSGLAHLVEHLYVTSAAGAAPGRTAEAFFGRYPAGCNAQTGDRYTVVATVFPKRELENELREAAARMGDLRITAADLDREKPRLIEEVSNMFGRFPALGAVNVTRELIRPTPGGGRKGGLPEHVHKITLEDVRDHWTRYYKPANATLIIAGAVDEPAAREVLQAHFAKIEAGQAVPKSGEPGSARKGAVRELTVQSLQPQTEPVACLAYAAADPASSLYAPFLVLVARFYASAAKPGGGAVRPSIYFPLLDDPAVIGTSVSAKAGETADRTIARLENFVAETIAPTLREADRAAARQVFALPLGTTQIPDFALAQNPYAVAFALGRREQLGIDPVKLAGAFDGVTEKDLRRAADEIFNPKQHAAAVISAAK